MCGTGFTTACPTLEQLASLRHLRCLHLGCSGISWAPDGSDGSTSSSGREGSPRAELAALLCLSSQARLPNTPMPPQVISACHALGGWDALRELHLGRLPLDSQVLAALATSHITRLVAYRLQSPAGAYPPLGQPPEAELLAALSATKRGTALLPLPPLLRSLQLRRLPNLAALAALHPAPASLEHLTTSDSPHDSLPCTTITITLQPWQQIVSPDADQAAEDYWELADLHIYANSQLAGIVPHCMPSAAAFLAARRNEPTSLRVRAWEKKCKVSKMLEDVGTGFGLDGPHAAWMAALRPLGRTITSLELRNLAPTAPGDMTALAAALPALEVRRCTRRLLNSPWSVASPLPFPHECAARMLCAAARSQAAAPPRPCMRLLCVWVALPVQCGVWPACALHLAPVMPPPCCGCLRLHAHAHHTAG